MVAVNGDYTQNPFRERVFHSSPSEPFPCTHRGNIVGTEQISGEVCSTSVPRLRSESGAFSFWAIRITVVDRRQRSKPLAKEA